MNVVTFIYNSKSLIFPLTFQFTFWCFGSLKLAEVELLDNWAFIPIPAGYTSWHFHYKQTIASESIVKMLQKYKIVRVENRRTPNSVVIPGQLTGRPGKCSIMV